MVSLFKYRIITALALIIFAAVYQAHAQGDIVGGAVSTRKDLSGGASGGISRPSGNIGGGGGTSRPKRTRTNTVTVQNAKRGTNTVATPPPSMGSLSVVAEPGATVFLDPPGSGQSLRGEVGSDRIFIFDKLRPGTYTVTAELNGEEYADRQVTIARNTPTSVSMEAPTYSAVISTNVQGGSVRYAPAVIRGNSYEVTGKTIYEELRAGRANLTGLKPGRYVADIIPTDPGFEQDQISFVISDNTTIPVKLENRESKQTFSDAFTSMTSWESAPGGWRASSGLMTVAGPGVAIPRNKDYRFYKDFQLSSDVKMVNGVAATFVLRARDSRNYYMVQLTGANADEPFTLRGYIVREGVSSQMGGTASIASFSSTLATNKFFKVTMKMTDNKVRVSITDSQTGEILPLGVLSDPNNSFPIGAAGLGVRDREQNEIGSFIVCTPSCQ
jgi:hypothetical protein